MSGFGVSFLGYGPSIVRNCLFCNFLADVSKKSKAVIAVYVYASESSRFALLEKKILTFAVNEFC